MQLFQFLFVFLWEPGEPLYEHRTFFCDPVQDKLLILLFVVIFTTLLLI